MKKTIKYFLIILALFMTYDLSAQQQRPVQSLYMFDQLLINPAYAGSQVQLSATAIYRNQWVNLEGAPKTLTASLQSSLLRGKMGVGLVLAKDVIGVHEDFSIFASYSYRIKMKSTGGTLSMGLQAGLNSIQSDFTKTTVPSVNQGSGMPGTSDPFYRATNALNPNFGAGFFYTNKAFYLGFSVPTLLNNEIIQDTELAIETIKNTRSYFVSIGNTFPMSKDFKIIGSTLLRFQEGAPFSFDINANGVYKETVGLGVSYRLVEGFVYLFELKINENFHVGYAYDMTTSGLGRVSNGSHEFLINYRIKIPSLHKGLECPSYF